MSKSNQWWFNGLLALLFITTLLRFWNLSSLPYAIFDEHLLATMTTQYIAGTPFVEVHPPVARLHFAVVAYIAGAKADQRFESILLPYKEYPYKFVRGVSALAGVLLVLFSALLTKEITKSNFASLLVAFFITFENSLVLYSRLILPDMLLLMYGTAGLWAFLVKDKYHTKSKKWYGWLIFSILLFSLSAGTKVTGFFFPLIALIHTLRFVRTKHVKEDIQMFLYLFAVPFIFGILLTAFHFSLLDRTGPVHSQIFEETVTFFDGVRDNNIFYAINFQLGILTQVISEATLAQLYTVGAHFGPDNSMATSSPAWFWPFMQKPMTFAIMPIENLLRIVYLIGNPIIWLGSTLAFIYLIKQRITKKKYHHLDTIFISYAVYLLALSLIGRNMYLYHYFPTLLLAIILLAVAIKELNKSRTILTALFAIFSIAIFWLIAPYSYGLPLNEKQLEIRQVFSIYDPLADRALEQVKPEISTP